MNIHAERHSRSVALARAHGLSNVIGGGWPLLHRRSFEAVFGAKTDRWLLYTVAGLLVGNGAVQLMAGHSAPERRLARAVGMSTSTWLLTIDLIYVSAG
ncbi:hypothetical protein [Rhodococcus erythropolis]|uniref:hypothetical protein n=1 Tax=Rhodococcus erythropolis TaxID=1833 RepID=UPI001BE6CD9F|nr:hypothetical protein [Rhodococcus erythropolis]MBT2269871.1 hypothetical protein [Rhodococcus erythropolis]